uniref:Glucose-1-phosphatase n=1 Tax=Heliothis virescens TaxID=7102 RepID=A0A2A4IYT5_HELVI
MAAILTVLLCFFSLCKGIDVHRLNLEQVLILSRHNVRTPLTGELEMYSSKPWPNWNASSGLLTRKGYQLEGYMGEYLSDWFASENFFDGCPGEDEIIVYSNTKPRTIASAKSFVESAFKSCNITVQHHDNLAAMDPMFLPIFHNRTDAFKKQAREEMQRKLNEVNLTDAYREMTRILNMESSDVCKKLLICDLVALKSEIVTEDGEEPNVNGPLFIANAIVDSFIMSYYEGMPLSDVAWGEMQDNSTQWDLLTSIARENQNVKFNLTTASKDLAGPLLKYMFDIFKSGTPKFTLLVGHDSNLNSVINALDFKPFVLPGQFEPFPIGGKVVFQKWSDGKEKYLKIEYVYPTVKQLRNGERLSRLEPPQRVLLEPKGCKMSAAGLCLWSDFLKLNTFS